MLSTIFSNVKLNYLWYDIIFVIEVMIIDNYCWKTYPGFLTCTWMDQGFSQNTLVSEYY